MSSASEVNSKNNRNYTGNQAWSITVVRPSGPPYSDLPTTAEDIGRQTCHHLRGAEPRKGRGLARTSETLVRWFRGKGAHTPHAGASWSIKIRSPDTSCHQPDRRPRGRTPRSSEDFPQDARPLAQPARSPPHLSPTPSDTRPLPGSRSTSRSAIRMPSSRLLSPSFHAAPWWGPQSGGPGPAKRRQIEEPAGPEDGMAPSLQGPAGSRAAEALTSVLVLAAGCALQLPLDGVDLVLEPEPTSALQVSLGGHTLVLVPEALLGPGAGAHPPDGLEPGALLGGPAGGVAIQQGFFCAFVPEIAVQEEARHQDEDAAPGFLTPWMVPAAGLVAGTGLGTHPHGPIREPWPRAPTPSPERCPPGPYFNLNFHLWERFPSSPLQALPPSPSPGPQVRAPPAPSGACSQGPETPLPGMNCYNPVPRG